MEGHTDMEEKQENAGRGHGKPEACAGEGEVKW